MKRVVASILSLIIVLGVFNCYALSETLTTMTEEQETLLRLTGVIDDGADWDKIITKGEFAGIIAKVAFHLDCDVKNHSVEGNVSDVKKGQKYYDAVTALVSRGYAATDKFGYFYPNENLTIDMAYDMIVRTLGYSEITPYIDGGVNYLASRKGLDKGVSLNSSNEVSLYNAYILIYNMLKCDVTDLRNLKLDNSSNELVYMTVRLGLYEINGVVTDDGNISIYGKSETNEGSIVIDDGNEMVNKTGKSDLLGVNICGYFTHDKLNDEYVLLAAFERKNNIIELASKNIQKFEERTYTYVADEYVQATKKFKIAKDATILYNNRPLKLDDTFSKDKYIPENGRVRLYDNDNDGDAELVRIEEYITDIVQLVNVKEEKIYVINNRPFYSLQEKKYAIYDENGEELTLSAIPVGAVISVMVDLSNEYYKIYVSTEKQIETVKTYSSKSEYEAAYVKTVSGGRYDFSSYAEENYKAPELNGTYEFVFDIFDNVAGYSKDETNTDWQYGYLVWIRENDESGNDEYFAKIYSQNGEFYTYTLNKKIDVINEDDTVIKYAANIAAQDVTYSGIVRYKLNSSELLTDLEIPHKYGERPTETDRLYCVIDTVNHEDSNNYYTRIIKDSINYGGAMVVSNKATVFNVPQDNKEYEKYEIGDSSSFVNGKFYSLIAYGTDYRSNNAECVVFTVKDSTSTAINNEWPSVVSKVYVSYDEHKDNEVYAIETENSKFFMEPEVYENQVFSIANGEASPIKIQPGDIIYMKSNSDSYITKAVLVYDADRIVTDEKGNQIKGAIAGTKISYFSENNTLCSPFTCNDYVALNPGNRMSWKFNSAAIRVWSGWVYSYEDGYLYITNQNPAYGYNYNAKRTQGFLTEAVHCDMNMAVTVKINSNGKRDVFSATYDDIKPYTVYGADCSRIVVTQRVYDMRSICIINEE